MRPRCGKVSRGKDERAGQLAAAVCKRERRETKRGWGRGGGVEEGGALTVGLVGRDGGGGSREEGDKRERERELHRRKRLGR